MKTSAASRSGSSVSPQQKKADQAYLRAVKSFSGFLEGVGKSPATIECYLRDLKTFRRFFLHDLAKLGVKDLDSYPEFLKKEGFRVNTRRRQMLTVRSFLRYLRTRKKLQVDLASRVPSFERSERIPHTFEVEELRQRIQALPATTEIETRNRAVLWVLLETGCQVSELPRLREKNILSSSSGPRVRLGDWDQGVEREVPVSSEMVEAVKALTYLQWSRRSRSSRSGSEAGYLFEGFNKFGPMGCITPRGIELLVKHYAIQFKTPQMKPRNLRHSIVIHWLESGVPLEEVRERLGLKSDYALRLYRAMIEAREGSS